MGIFSFQRVCEAFQMNDDYNCEIQATSGLSNFHNIYIIINFPTDEILASQQLKESASQWLKF